jgi:two-component system, cell cycle response regulator
VASRKAQSRCRQAPAAFQLESYDLLLLRRIETMPCLLIIEDSDKFRRQIIRTVMEVSLFENYREARDGLEGFKSIMEEKPDLVICDLVMPRLDGFQFLQMVKARPELHDIPIIFLTSKSDQASKVRLLEEGASDYLTKPFDAAELVARVKIHLKIKKLQDDLKRATEHFKELSNTDPLTNLYNRRFFSEVLENEMQRAKRLRTSLSLIILDVDKYKEINDLYGHQEGDKVLIAVAEKLHGALRTYDVASRYGGDEFVLLLPATALPGALEVAERLRASVNSISFLPPLEGVSVTVSQGVATFPTEQINSVDSLFYQADYALYQAKQNGRNRVETASTDTPST